TSNRTEQVSLYEPSSLIHNGKFPTYLATTDNTHVQLLSHIKHMLQKHETKHVGYELGLRGLMLMLFSDVYEHDLLEKGLVQKNNQSSETRMLIKKVLNFMEIHFQENIELDQLAAIISFSRSHFCRFFKTQTNMRPLEYLNYIRINNAANMLRNGNFTVLEAAIESG